MMVILRHDLQGCEHLFRCFLVIYWFLLNFGAGSDSAEANQVEGAAESPAFREVVLDLNIAISDPLAR